MQFGHELAAVLPIGAVVLLNGTLGAGKTRLVQAVAEALGIDPETVVSPTFTICNEYAGRRRIDHWDLYRVRGEDELLELGMEEYFEAPGLTFVEWADRFPASMPEERLEVTIEVLDESSRRITVRGIGSELEEALNRMSG
jgi:tRNA threonylcarbamoyladenosine biosynthesis protein TsaE